MSSNERRQRVERVAGSRRAKLTPAPGTRPEPVPRDDTNGVGAEASVDTSGPNDERMLRDVPPHY
ncbi:hypothetical protein FHX49_000508 [Microbacterium endophyticum]|uniref:Uncharacterized protein n=1 Tax=Microbacterium endophyticum TaxID=1526412 RepID=A0A7W4V198_9MICO|nr:hypothetical protein [Microbacterium endophyticum]MBB2974967.1 hypothetical protein [Microbacterium endophyticum]NIK37264.1 hypothetical protein [Microbacterium endophyticum]